MGETNDNNGQTGRVSTEGRTALLLVEVVAEAKEEVELTEFTVVSITGPSLVSTSSSSES